ncbi:hypothetical protein COHA_008440 [Chlorella ohadii]|uniref:Pentacotripeptide-repeat region of PRORP domain-containing protein n=1 Tax=Chlorella ohadii TaxID=2649997 RepID=A0AAD5DJU2_9CHLO|nr:hypothetical protein COHA_008440 [Chlorella ohadii]
MAHQPRLPRPPSSPQRLKPGQPVIDAVRDGLYSLDSRAVAALLKELSKSGQPQRASELFDWLRALPRDHQLSKLADLYTYTTLISQCGSHQQLRRALELVGEMRSRGIEANIHTYSALMSVCVKCNECDLALDVFQQLLAEGCSPNLVTFNILIDIHGKQGAWAKAVEVLDQLHAQGLTAEPRTYNTIISACSKAGQPGAAARVYERMLADGVQPTGTTYTSLISAFGKAGQVEEALRVYQDMAARGCERNVITYSSLISACERAGRCDIALRLWEEMRREGCRPNVVTYNALIGACAQAGMWAKAAEAFEAMLASGCRPDAVTHSVLISAYERGGQWRRCLQAFEMMQQQGFRPDACVYNVVLEALISSGLVSAQVKAVQLSAVAHRQGHLRLTALNAFESTATAHTYGAAFIATLRWLAELREAPPAAAMPLAFAAGAGLALGLGAPLQPVSLLLTRGKHCRGDQSYTPIQAALTACFEAFSVPVAAKVTGQGLVLHADAFALTAWLATPSAAALLSPLDAAAAPNGRDGSASAAGAAALSGALLADDVAADMQCSKAFAAVLEFEAGHAMGNSDLLSSSPQAAALRQSLVSSIVALAASLGVQEETALDAVQLCDRAMASGVAMEAGLAPLYAAAMLLLCARQSGEAGHVLEQEVPLAQLIGLPLSTVLEAEAHVAAALGGDTGAVSALRVLQLYLERLGCTLLALQKCQLLEVMAVAAVTLARKAALSPAFARVRPSVLAAACLLKAREGLGLSPAWPRTLQSMTAYAPAPGSPLQQCLEVMALLGLNASLA